MFENVTTTYVKDIVTIIGYCVAIVGGIYGFYKWFLPRISPTLANHWYYYSTGVHVIRDIEIQFGKNAGKVIKDIMMQRGRDILIDEMRLDIIENAVGIGIFICNDIGECTYANKTLALMFGMDQTGMLNYGWVGPIVDKPTAMAEWKFSVANNTPYRATYQVKVNGKIRNCYAEAEASIDEHKTVKLGYVGIVKYTD